MPTRLAAEEECDWEAMSGKGGDGGGNERTRAVEAG